MFHIGITDCQRAVFFPWGIYNYKVDGVTPRYAQFILFELPDGSPIKVRFNSDILDNWGFSAANNVTTETVTVGADTFIIATVASPRNEYDRIGYDNKYYVKLYNKKLPVATEYKYDPEKDATTPVIEYELIRG